MSKGIEEALLITKMMQSNALRIEQKGIIQCMFRLGGIAVARVSIFHPGACFVAKLKYTSVDYLKIHFHSRTLPRTSPSWSQNLPGNLRAPQIRWQLLICSFASFSVYPKKGFLRETIGDPLFGYKVDP